MKKRYYYNRSKKNINRILLLKAVIKEEELPILDESLLNTYFRLQSTVQSLSFVFCSLLKCVPERGGFCANDEQVV